MAKKLVLAYVDSLRTDMLRQTIDEGRAPTFSRLLKRGTLVGDCVSSFPSVTPVASAEMVTGVQADQHWISGMNWFHRAEQRYVEYGSSLEATRAFGLFRSLHDLVYNMNLSHLSPSVETVFETLDDVDIRTASTPFLIYRGRHRHEVNIAGITGKAIEAGILKFDYGTWGPRELFYGDLYTSMETKCKPSSIPGKRDMYSACCGAELISRDAFDFMLLAFPDNDNYSHRHGPLASVRSIERADYCMAEVVRAAGGIEPFLKDHALILLAELVLGIGAIRAGSLELGVADGSAAPILDRSNIESIGALLYGKYLFLFETAGIILLVAMIGAIVLTHRERKGTPEASPDDGQYSGADECGDFADAEDEPRFVFAHADVVCGHDGGHTPDRGLGEAPNREDHEEADPREENTARRLFGDAVALDGRAQRRDVHR